MSACTPGPWVVEPIADGLTYQITTSEPEGFVVIMETPWGDEHDIANARLVAAAPDMRDALHLLRAVRPENWDDGDDAETATAWRALDAALAKSEGRS